MSSPTYGTDKTAGVQLVEDMSNVLKPMPERKAPIAYNPRPELVRPQNARNAQLPPPQEDIASASNPDWPESPEERRRRVRAEGDEANAQGAFRGAKGPIANEEVAQIESATSTYDSGKLGESQRYRPGTDIVGQEQRRAQLRAKLKETNEGSPTTRRFLSEPPLVYRQPAADAVVGDIGEDEWKKERRLKAEARKKSGKTSWRDYLPEW